MASITVIIPVLNGMPYLSEMLASLEAQTLRDFTVLFWDNGSTDGTLEEAAKWIPSRLPGRIVTGEPLPLQRCLARMVEISETEFCARMDGDDIALPERFRLQMEFLRKHPEVSLVGTQFECIDPSGVILPKEEWARCPTRHDDIVSRLMYYCPYSHPSIFFRREAVLAAGNYAVPAPVEDLNLYLRFLPKFRGANLSEVLTHYRIHPTSICAAAKQGNRQADLAAESLAKESPGIFGISSDDFARLYAKKYRFSAWPLLRGAWRRSSYQPGRFWNMITSPWFLQSARCMTAPGDFPSKVLYKMLELL